MLVEGFLKHLLLFTMSTCIMDWADLVSKLTGTGGTLVGHTLGAMLSLDVVGQLDLLLEDLLTLLALVVDVLQQWLAGMHPLEVSPQRVSVGRNVTADLTFLQLLAGFLVVLRNVDGPLRDAPEEISAEAALVAQLLVQEAFLVAVPQVAPHPVLGVGH